MSVTPFSSSPTHVHVVGMPGFNRGVLQVLLYTLFYSELFFLIRAFFYNSDLYFYNQSFLYQTFLCLSSSAATFILLISQDEQEKSGHYTRKLS